MTTPTSPRRKRQNAERSLALNFSLCCHREEQRKEVGRKLCRVRIGESLQQQNKRSARR